MKISAGPTMISAIDSIAAVFIEIPWLAIYAYIAVHLYGSGLPILNVCIIEINPKHLRLLELFCYLYKYCIHKLLITEQ